jgi:hypothetical protein
MTRLSSALADLFLDEDIRASAHVSFALPSGAVLVVPKAGRARRGALALYNPQRVTGRVAKALMWSGIWRGTVAHVQPRPLEELQTILAGLLGEPRLQCAFYFGATGIYSKAVILAIDSAGRPLAYGKLAALPVAQQAVRHEGCTLDHLAAATGLRGWIPRVLAETQWREFPLLVLSAGPSAGAPKRFDAMHRAFLGMLKEATCEPAKLLDSIAWRDMNATLARRRERLAPAWRDRYDWALPELERRLGSVRLDLSLAHRDFVCWNTRTNADGSLYVFDWEFARRGSTPGWDFFHFHVALRAVLGRALDRDGVAALTSAAHREGLAPAEDLLLAYLADVALFHHDSLLDAGEDNHPVLEIAAQGIDVLRVQKPG